MATFDIPYAVVGKGRFPISPMLAIPVESATKMGLDESFSSGHTT